MDLRELAAQLAAEAAEQPQEATGGAGEGKPPVMLQREQERRTEAEKKALEVYKEYQKNIRNSESAQTTILKGLQAGENPYKLLLSACECIGYLTSNKAFSEMARGNILEIVGKGLLQPEALEIELEGVKSRLAMLTRPELEAEPPDSRRRIGAAIRAHQKRAGEIERALSIPGQ